MESIVFDLETTGLSGDDEIVQISIIDGEGNTLIDSLVKPTQHTSWTEAERIHGISPEMVEDAPTAEDLMPKVRKIFSSAEKWISYNGSFDLGFLKSWGVDQKGKQHIDVMQLFSPIYGEWNDHFGDYKWQKLTTAAAYYGYKFAAHDSLEDVRATLFVYNAICQSN